MKSRLISIDAFRGFDMFWITGGGALLCAIASAFPGGADSIVVRQLHHVEWEGVRFEDLIFPVFLFISGLTYPFSHAGQLARGVSSVSQHLKVLRRALALIAIGMVYNGFLCCDWHALGDFRYASVLGKIGVAWGVAALVYLHCRLRGRIMLCVAGLVGYGVMLAFTAPDAPTGAVSTSLEGCFVGWLDRHFTPGHLYCANLMEPSGPFVSFFGYPTALIGMLAGDCLRFERFEPTRKSFHLLVAGVVCLVIGFGLSPACPIIKKLWTPSFTLVSCGWGLIAFSAFYYLIDVRGWSKWAYFFRVIGANAIVAYLAGRLIDIGKTSRFFLGGLASLLPSSCSDVLLATGNVAVLWLLLNFLYRHKCYFKV